MFLSCLSKTIVLQMPHGILYVALSGDILDFHTLGPKLAMRMIMLVIAMMIVSMRLMLTLLGRQVVAAGGLAGTRADAKVALDCFPCCPRKRDAFQPGILTVTSR